jgi:LPS-assembly protein
MRKLSAIALLVLFAAIFSPPGLAQEEPQVEMGALNQILPGVAVGSVYIKDGMWFGTNWIYVHRGNTMLTAESGTFNPQTGEAVADGRVRIEEGDQIWAGEHIRYNFKTHMMQSEVFRTGKPPVFAAGTDLKGNTTNQTYNARHVFVTTDDVSDPAVRVRATRVKIVPGQYIEMWNAVVYAKGVPVFYFPYYKRNLGEHANNLDLLPGYRSVYGGYLLTTYTWFLGNAADGQIHADYLAKRGPGIGPDVNLHLGQWGDLTAKYYYIHDNRPNTSSDNFSFTNASGTTTQFGNIPENRQRFYLGWQATPATNLNLKAMVNYQTDPLVLHDFFEGDYTANPQPNTFVEANKYWDNWSLDALMTPRVNSFFNQIERLPDVKLTGLCQQVFNTPLYYESESSVGYYRSFVTYTNGLYPGTNGFYMNSAARADTYHQLLLPETLFGWLNVMPRAGGRFTYYSEENTATAGVNDETYRRVFNAGADVSFKLSRLWTGATNSLLQIDGLRHIIEPSVSYIYVPNPSTPPTQLPQFDSQVPSLLELPVQFPDYNDIDSIDSQNVVRFGLRNTLQTKRDGQLDTLLDWNLMLDWNLNPNQQTNTLPNYDATPLGPQQTFDDLYSELTFRPRSWLALESQLRYDINNSAGTNGRVTLAFHQLTFTPNEKWSWGIGHWYLQNNFFGNGSSGDNFITSTMFYRMNDNWGLRATHFFNAQDGRLQEQFYSLYRDLRSWTAALTFRVDDSGIGPEDYTIAFSFSLKARPKTHPGDDAVSPYHLVGE